MPKFLIGKTNIVSLEAARAMHAANEHSGAFGACSNNNPANASSVLLDKLA